MNTIYILYDRPDYEPGEVIAAYRDKEEAERVKDRMRDARDAWGREQERLHAAGDESAYVSDSPHDYADLCVVPCRLFTQGEAEL